MCTYQVIEVLVVDYYQVLQYYLALGRQYSRASSTASHYQ